MTPSFGKSGRNAAKRKFKSPARSPSDPIILPRTPPEYAWYTSRACSYAAFASSISSRLMNRSFCLQH